MIGGLPDISSLPVSSISNLPTPFKGCIRHFSINSIHIPLNRDTILNGRNINDCDGTPCGKDVCLNDGTCWLDSFMKPHCSCPFPYHGLHCENISCNSSNCINNGSCKIGYEGAYCEKRIQITTPEFSGKSFLLINKNNEKKRDLKNLELKKLYLNFTTIRKDGLILWSRKSNSFIGVGLEKGFLKIVYSIENSIDSTISLPFYYKISDGLWHSIEIDFAPFSIKLDQNKIVHKSKYRKHVESVAILTDGFFYIGGIPMKSISKETNGTFSENFQGCIEGFATNGGKIIKDFTQFDGRNVNVCKIP